MSVGSDATRIQDNEAWRRLGEAHAENDRDDRAIAALTQAINIAPKYVQMYKYGCSLGLTAHCWP